MTFLRRLRSTSLLTRFGVISLLLTFAVGVVLSSVLSTVIEDRARQQAEDAALKLGSSLDEVFPKQDYQIMHTLLFPHDIVHIENLGGEIDRVLDSKVTFGCFPWRFQGGEAAFCRAVAFLD